MKDLKIYLILGLSALFVLSACKKDQLRSPVLTLSQTTLNVSGEGGVYSVAYRIDNPVDGATISVDLGGVTWITDATITTSTIDLTVEANSESSSRTATLTVSYPNAEDASLSVVQEAVEIKYDYDFEATTATVSCYVKFGNHMNVEVMFTDMDYIDGSFNPPGTVLYLDTYMPYDEDGKIAMGTYEVNTTTASMSIYPGYYTYLRKYENESDYTSGYINSGTMTITAGTEDDNYVIVCDFLTEDGATVKCTYEGYLVVDDIPGPISTLTEDITLELGDAVGIAEDYSVYYGGGGKSWLVYIGPEDGVGVTLTLDINSTWGDTIPTETYTPSSSATPAVGEYMTGYLYSGYLYGTGYFELDESGNFLNMSPATSGDITFTNNGDGTHTVEFECKDDLGYTWSGTWTGTFTYVDYSDYFSASTSATSLNKRSVVSKFSKQRR